MRVVLVKQWYDPALRDPDALIAADDLRRELALALAARGHEVRVVQEFAHAATRPGWVFVPGGARLRGLLARLGDAHPHIHAPAPHLRAPILAFRPDVVHAFDLVAFLAMGSLPRPLVATFHGGAPARRAAWRLAQRWGLRDSTLLFTTVEQGRGFGRPVRALPELSTPLRRVEAPRLPGRPALLWTGRLDPVKDPLTGLRAFEAFARVFPDTHLSVAWSEAPLLDEVRAFVEARLRGRVSLLGPQPPAAMAALYSGADRFLQASVREVCGRALLEAMACGLSPVVTDIPPFRALVPEARVLFPVGDAAAAAAALAQPPIEGLAAWFERELSYAALARRLEGVYRDVSQNSK